MPPTLTGSVSGKIRKKCPAVIVSNDAATKHLNRLQVVPLTSNTGRLYPSEAYVQVGNTRSKAMADQLTTASKERLLNKAGEITTQEMAAIERAIKTHLDLH